MSSTRVVKDTSAEVRELAPTPRPQVAVMAASWIERVVGSKPERTWLEEWPAMRVEEMLLTGQHRGETPKWVAENAPPSRFLKFSAQAVKWKRSAGWSEEDADAETAISSNGHAAIGAAVRDRSDRYAASTYAACEALLTAARMMEAPEPPTFRHLHGLMSLTTTDAAWRSLPDAEVGHSFVTSTIAFASDHSDSLTETGYCVPVIDTDGKLTYRPQDSDVVCFVSAPPDGRGFHSLVQVSPSGYHLPPMTTVTLQKVESPGSWQAYGRRIRRRLFTVSVAYAGGECGSPPSQGST